MPRMLRAMISDLLSAEPDMTIVGNSYGEEDGLPAAGAELADILIAQEEASHPGTAAVLFGAPAAILALAPDGRHGTGVNFVRQPISLNGSGLSLPDAVRKLLGQPTCIAVRNDD